MRIVTNVTGAMQRLARQPGYTLFREAKGRLAWLTWHAQQGHSVRLTCWPFGISRQSFYRWQQRYDPRALRTLEGRPRRAKKRWRSTWTAEQRAAVGALREQEVCWGKGKLAVLLERQGLVLSGSMVGCILTHLKRTGRLVEPVWLRRTRARLSRWRWLHAVRKPKGYVVEARGDLVQVDTVGVRPEAGVVLKQFTAHDVVRRWEVLEVAGGATATTAVRVLEGVLARMPFGVTVLQVDGGSEFRAEVEVGVRPRGGGNARCRHAVRS